MATIVKGDLYYKLDGKLDEIKRQMRQKEGYGFNPERLDLALQAIIEGRFEAVGGQFPSVILAAEFIPEYTDKGGGKKKWEIVEDVTPSKFEVKDLELVSFLKSGEKYVPGETMRWRAHDLKANLGLADAKYVLDHSEEIPPEFRGKYLVFSSTLLRDSYGRLYVAYLCWDGSRWCLDFGWLGREWHDGERLVRCK